MDLSFVILNYKQCALVDVCIRGIEQAGLKFQYQIIVVDNASDENCLKRLSKKFPDIIAVQAKSNRGFASGNNLGIKIAQGKYIVVINPDIVMESGIMEQLYAFLEAHPQVCITAPKLIYPDGSLQYSCRRYPRLLTPLFRRTLIGNFRFAQKEISRYLMKEKDHNKDFSVDWLFGAFLMIRKSALEKVGLFDERFFLYFEDLDLCRRFNEAGFEVWYKGSITAVHYHHRESAERPGFLAVFDNLGRIHILSGIRYFLKYR